MAAAAAQEILEADLEDAVSAYKEQVTYMNPTRVEYDSLFFKHKKLQARYERAIHKLSSKQPAYRQHKRYFSYLSNALLASNASLRSSPRPFSDLQTLTHATLMHAFAHASHTLTDMVYENKRLDKMKDLYFELDQRLVEKCHIIFHTVDRDCKKLDQLHVEVLAAEKKLGKKPGCGVEEGKCPACARTKAEAEREAKAAAEKEAKEAAVKEAKAAVDKEAKTNKGRFKSTRKGPKAKGMLEDIVEEEFGDWANSRF